MLAVAAASLAVCALIVWSDPLAPVLLIAGAFGAAGSLILLQYPLGTCYLAAFLSLWPFGARPAGLDLVYTVAVNGALALALASLLLQSLQGRRQLRLTPSCAAMGLFIVWALVTVFWASDLVEARKTLVAFTSGLILLFVLTNQTRTPQTIDSFMTVLRVLGWVLIGAGVLALLEKGYQSGTRLKVMSMNENEFGLVVISTVPGVLWPVMRRQGLRRLVDMVLSFIFLIAALILIALTGSRGSSLSLLLVMLSFLFSRPLRPWGASSLIVCLVMLAAAPLVLTSVISRFAEHDGGEFGGRDLLWRAGFALLADAPWTGVGIGNGPFKLHDYIAVLTNQFNWRMDLPTHNPLLEVGIDTGIIGLSLYAAATIAAFRQFFGAAARANLRAHGLVGYFPLILGIAVGYYSAWIKGGGVECHPSFFAMLALLQFPSQLAPIARPASPRSEERRMQSGDWIPEGNVHA
jgi:putative inorganic carbon (hco3(-)) transporter